MCWHAPVNLALEKEKQEDREPEGIFRYTVSSKLAGDYETLSLNKSFKEELNSVIFRKMEGTGDYHVSEIRQTNIACFSSQHLNFFKKKYN